jgi:hypothetical protein
VTCHEATWRCKLRDSGRHGVEAQFLQNGELLVGQLFPTRTAAIAWAEDERGTIERG